MRSAEHTTAIESDGVLRIALFGEPRISYGDHRVGWPTSPAAAALLGFLSLHPGELRRDAVAFALWPDETEETSRARLRKALFGLHGALAGANGRRDWIVADKHVIAWNRERRIEIDVLEFLGSIDDAAATEAALATYDRTMLAGVDAAWIEAKRTAVADRYGTLLERLFGEAVAAGERTKARRYAGLLVDHDPLREDVVRELMTLCSEGGDRSGALRVYRDFERHVARELDGAPEDATRELYERILADRQTQPAARSHLPAAPTSFVGRAAEVTELTAMVRRSRIVTVLGPGGVGKSRLAVETARSLAEAFPDGAWLIELARIADPQLVAEEMARAVDGASTAAGDPAAALTRLIGERRALLVIDNCEHVLDAAVNVLAELVGRCPNVHVLVTSRERLRMTGEVTYLLGTLATPPSDVNSPDALVSFSGIQLFVDRAATISAGAARLDATTAAAIAAIVRRTDGLPLAIELAVPWLRVFSVDELATRLNDRFAVLVGGNRNTLPRHQTLEALIGWSYDALPERERLAFLRIAAFAGSLTIAAAAAVVSGVVPPPIAAYAVVAALLDKSLLAPAGDRGDRTIVLDALREYAAQRISPPELAAARDAHAAHHLALAEEAERLRHEGAPEARWVDPLIDDRHNLHAALDWCLEGDGDPLAGAQMAVALSRFFEYEPPTNGMRWYELALARTPEDQAVLRNRLELRYLIVSRHVNAHFPIEVLKTIAHRAANVDPLTEHHALGWLAAELSVNGRIEEARSAAKRCTDLARRFGTNGDVVWALAFEIGISSPDHDVIALHREQFARSETFGPNRASASAATMLAAHLNHSGDAEGALHYARTSLDHFASLAHPPPMLHLVALKLFGDIAFRHGDAGAVREPARLMLDIAILHDAPYFAAAAMDFIARFELVAKRYPAAARLTGYVRAHGRDEDVPHSAHDLVPIPAPDVMPALEAALDAETLERLLAEGSFWDFERAVAEARRLL